MDDIRTERAFDPDERYGQDVKLPERTGNEQERQNVLRKLESWWQECRAMHAENRQQMIIDADFYDGDQFDEETRAVLEGRNQAPLVYNIIHPTIQWVVGTERRTRIDWKVLGRGPEDQNMAEVKTDTMKYVSDTNNAGWMRSVAFKDAVIVGVGWTEEFLRTDVLEEEIGVRHQDWKQMWWDPFSRALDMSDCRYIFRAKDLDVDVAITMFPEHAQVLNSQAREFGDSDMDDIEGASEDLPSMFYNSESRKAKAQMYLGGVTSTETTTRARVRVIECEFKRTVAAKRIRSLAREFDDLHGATFDPQNPDPRVEEGKRRGVISLIDGVTDRVWKAFFVPGTLLGLAPLQYRHGKFSFTPIWCYRRHRDGMPYGLIRQVRDPQEDYNKRRGKALFAMSVNRVLYEEDAFSEDDEDDMLDETAKPNGRIRLRSNALAAGKIRIDEPLDVAQGHLNLAEQSKTQILETVGVTRDNLGQESSASSGKAILAKQQQGAVVTAEVFDNYRLAIKLSGQKTLQLIEQYMLVPKVIRVLGDDQKPKFVEINQPYVDPWTGQVLFNNDIAASQADFIVDQQDYRETMRMAMAEQLFEMIGRLPPEMAIQFLDLPIDLSDIPNKHEWVARIRKFNGMDAEPLTAEQENDQRAAAERARRAEELQQEVIAAKARRDNAAASEAEARAANQRLQGKAQAIDVAGLAAASVPLVPAADRLYQAPT